MFNVDYSVLLSVYEKEKPQYLEECLESVFNQTYPSNDVVLVIDGPITASLDSVISKYSLLYKELKIIKLHENVGLGNALNVGLDSTINEIVLRMDTDDVSFLNRAEIQVRYLLNNPEVDVVGGYVLEFFEGKDDEYLKNVPLVDADIKKQMKKKNPMNHPSVAYRKSVITQNNGYIELKLNEDYYLWVRLAQANVKFANLDQALVRMRVDQKSYERRGGITYFRVQNLIYRYMYSLKMINIFEYVSGWIIRFIFRVLLPSKLRGDIYRLVLRNKQILN